MVKLRVGLLAMSLMVSPPSAWSFQSLRTSRRSSFLGLKPLLRDRYSDSSSSLEEPLLDLHRGDGHENRDSTSSMMILHPAHENNNDGVINGITNGITLATVATVSALFLIPTETLAAVSFGGANFDPKLFNPICSASDTFYQFLKSFTQSVVGAESFIEYGPLIASGLLRIRLELCVVESFFNEAVGPFIAQNGVGWILPWHETVETFLAGVVFSLATTFILVSSTKIVTVIATYTDFLVGAPCRLFGGFSFDRALGKPVTLDIGFGPFKKRLVGPPETKDDDGKVISDDGDIVAVLSSADLKNLPVIVVSGGVKSVGEVLRVVREVFDAIDLFVGKYLVLWVSFYIAFKFVHFKIFPDFP